ncbi:MAG: RNA polymerase sigma factor [Archangiaceae bacterium]|nr:RNA polymerase sigma factor [Archangiaceae bacterium]
MSSRQTSDVSELLRHAEWVRVLATRLVRDDRDDAVQELWLSAIKAPPDSERPARPWLARVLQNAARKRFRDEAIRARNEALTPAEHDAGPEELVGRVQVQQRLVRHVLELEEPFRQTVLLRFFEGLSSAEIAERLQVPAGTVRWRLKEALDRLRVSLDTEGREAWRLSVAPLVLPTAGPWLTAGVALMDKKIRFAVIAACLLLAGTLGWSWPSSAHHAEPTSVSQSPSSSAPVKTKPGPTAVAVPQAARPLQEAVAVTPATGLPAASLPPAEPSHGASDSDRARTSVTTNAASDGGTRFAIDREGIRAAMRSAIPEVKDCYESWLPMNPGLGGRLVVTFTIDTDDAVEGRITQIAVGDAGIGHVPLEGCILSSLSDLRFDPPLNGPINVNYPLVLSTLDGGR